MKGVSKRTREVAKTTILFVLPNPEPKEHSFSGPLTFPSSHFKRIRVAHLGTYITTVEDAQGTAIAKAEISISSTS